MLLKVFFFNTGKNNFYLFVIICFLLYIYLAELDYLIFENYIILYTQDNLNDTSQNNNNPTFYEIFISFINNLKSGMLDAYNIELNKEKEPDITIFK